LYTGLDAHVADRWPSSLERLQMLLDPSFLTALMLAFAVVAITDLIRTILWNTALRAVKPISCDTCMAFWLSVLGSLLIASTWQARAFWAVATAGIAITILAGLRYLRNDYAAAAPTLPVTTTTG
jgi:hypothetical protein